MIQESEGNWESKVFHEFDPQIDQWVALKTLARWEKKIAKELSFLEIPVFLPTIKQRTKYLSKTSETNIPLFSCYIFTSTEHFLGNKLISPFTRAKISKVLRPDNPQKLKTELLDLRNLLCSHELVQEKVFGKPGDKVRIVRGPLTGTEGTILRLKPNQKILVLEVGLLGRKLILEIGEELLARVV